ncbi:MAG: preprotein translocase subunit YajC [Propionibacteriaceae bacterium]|jgi:preprotein translocase subunit YajC|nr:preprotein translocase subunit YajC [Propionibacteriaceae bacterium]
MQGWGTLLLVGLLIVGLYFMMIRPAKRQQQAQQNLMNALSVGDRVMLNSGVYGTIRHLGDRQAIIEISPGVDLTVVRRAIVKSVQSDEEDFEYADSAELDAPAGAEATAELENWPVLEESDGAAAAEASTDDPQPADPASPTEPEPTPDK